MKMSTFMLGVFGFNVLISVINIAMAFNEHACVLGWFCALCGWISSFAVTMIVRLHE